MLYSDPVRILSFRLIEEEPAGGYTESNNALRSLSVVFVLACAASLKSVNADVAVEPYERRPVVLNQLLEERLTGLLPRLMRESQIDMWIVIAREYNDDPVFMSLVPKPRFTARRTTMLVFLDQGEGDLERLTVSRYPLGVESRMGRR